MKSETHHDIRVPWILYLSLTVCGVLLVAAVFYSLRVGGGLASRYAPLADAAMEVKLEAALAHLWFEETISGDSNEDLSKAMGHLDRSIWYAQAMLKGGENDEGIFLPVQDTVLIGHLINVLDKQQEFRRIANHRLELQSNEVVSGIGSELDQQFDQVFSELLHLADLVETQLQREMANKLAAFRLVQKTLLIGVAVGLLFVGIVLHWQFRRREIDRLRLAESERIQRLLFEGAPIGVFRADRNFQYESVNTALARIYGVASSIALTGAEDESELRRFADERHQQELLRLLAVTDEVLDYEMLREKADGTEVWVSTSIRILRGQGGIPYAFEGFVVDVTARKLAEEELVMTRDRAETANRTKSEFLATMSHELRTPLNGALGMLRLLQESETTREQDEYIEFANRSCKSLLQLLSDILDLSRIEADQLDLNLVDMDIGMLLRETETTFANLMREKSVYFQWSIDPRVPGLVHGDPIRVRQVLLNVVGNAIKFTDHGGVRVEVSALPGCKDGRIRLLFLVADSGVGIPDDSIGEIFNAFQQVDGTLSRRYGGVGLGLRIVKRLVDLMGGNIAVSSEVGVGTEVYFTICVKQTKNSVLAESPAIRKERVPARERARILLAEDDRVNLMFMRKILEKRGYVVTAAETGSKVLERLKEDEYCCVLMDIQMPDMDGVEATKAIRADHSHPDRSQVPIIALTAHAMSGDRDMFLGVGMDEYLPKPVNIDDLVELVDRYCKLEE